MSKSDPKPPVEEVVEDLESQFVGFPADELETAVDKLKAFAEERKIERRSNQPSKAEAGFIEAVDFFVKSAHEIEPAEEASQE